VDAGIVYVTDALTSNRVRVVASAPEEINAKILYPVAVTKSSRQVDAAWDYIAFLIGVPAKEVFQKYGFNLAPNPMPTTTAN
jgi:molybdate transport system substrate-binding protein